MSNDPIVRNAVSIGVATAVYAVSFGVLSVAAGFSVAQTCVMSLVCFTGASQLTFVSVIGAGGGVAGAIAPALLLAGRNAIYALSLKGILSGTVPERALRAQVVVDEPTAMAHAQPTLAEKRRAFDLTAVCLFTAWNIGTLAGALAGSGLGNPRDYGLDAMFPAVFLALLAPQLRGLDAVRAAVAGAIIALALLPATPAGVPIIAAALGAVPVLAASTRRRRGAVLPAPEVGP
jgi:4-azaleucine resistance transporter AzlC